uniref:S-adenosylmethionine mitochondrial carrier protein-like n=1 Tax=Saccoglossus kowalevskii TaxID=10224 RepID=A0ABM0LVF1_SACKO|nr:PREDICTED: S-adenosylmethionine mitochondrial carrier protein-like [Saccoglossus kowalevskii]
MANTGFQEISEKPPTFSVALTAGAFGGIIESVLLFPLDTLKTRLQSEAGFSKSGGFKRCYSGIYPCVIGYTPYVGVFFCVYESVKNKFSGFEHNKYHPLIHAGAGCLAEVIACTVGVPAEVVKQRTQANIQLSGMQILRKTLQKEVCAIVGCVTTPLDVAKTRIMLAKNGTFTATSTILHMVWREKGIQGLFAGMLPRVLRVSLGNYIFFAAYETFISKAMYN